MTIFPAIVKANKLNNDSIKLVRVDGAGKLVAMLEKRVDAMHENQRLVHDKTLATQQLKVGLNLVRAKDGESKPTGWMNPAYWEMTLDMAREYQELKTDMKPADFYTNTLIK